MSYEYTSEKRRKDTHALPNVEVFHVKRGEWYEDNGERRDAPTHEGELCEDESCRFHKGWEPCGEGFYYAFGFPGCLWDGEPMGPYETYEAALAAAREDSGDEDDEDEEEGEEG